MPNDLTALADECLKRSCEVGPKFQIGDLLLRVAGMLRAIAAHDARASAAAGDVRERVGRVLYQAASGSQDGLGMSHEEAIDAILVLPEIAPDRPSIDPNKCRKLYPKTLELAREAALKLGYTIAVHGSERRDLDLVAVPWIADAATAEQLARAIEQAVEGFIAPRLDGGEWPVMKPYGRCCWSIQLGGGPYIDLSVVAPDRPSDHERGWQHVPTEPTPDMRIAGGIAWSEAEATAETYVDTADACYKAMLAKAPARAPCPSPQRKDDGEAEGWRPIESAPKERHRFFGTPCLIGFAALNDSCVHVGPMVWIEQLSQWEFTELDDFDVFAVPTHWRPLPAPPSPAPDAGETLEGGKS